MFSNIQETVKKIHTLGTCVCIAVTKGPIHFLAAVCSSGGHRTARFEPLYLPYASFAMHCSACGRARI